MKKLLAIIFFVISCPLPIFASHARPRPDSLVCLLMEGKVINAAGGDNKLCRVELICDGGVIDSIMLKGKKKFNFDLKKNKHYIIRMSKPGFITKNICVHTTIPDTQTELFEFQFETTLLQEKPGQVIDPAAKDLPVASIYYHEKKRTFFYHRAFSTYYQKQLCKPYM
jgi:hypothetical protein